MKVVLISPYEIGRQPFGLAEPAALLQDAGCIVDCLDLSLQMLEPDVLRDADLVGIYLAIAHRDPDCHGGAAAYPRDGTCGASLRVRTLRSNERIAISRARRRDCTWWRI